MIGWAAVFSTTMSLIKWIGPAVPTAMKVFMRLLFGLVFMSPFIFKRGLHRLKTDHFLMHLIRTCLILAAMFCTYYAYAHLPLAFATSLGFTAPLMTTVLAILFLHERVASSHWVALMTGYMGVLIMVRPGVVAFDPAIGIALLANLFASSAIIFTRKLIQTESSAKILFYANILSVIVMLVIALFNWKTPTLAELFLLLLIGGIGVFSQYCNVQAYRYSQPSFLAPFEYLRLVFAIPIGIYLFDEKPDAWTLLGSLIIVLTTLYITTKESGI